MALPDCYESDSERNTSEEESRVNSNTETLNPNPVALKLLANENELLDSDSEESTKDSLCAIDVKAINHQNEAPGSSSTAAEDYKSIVDSPPDRIPSLLANYKTPHSQRRTSQQQKKKQQDEATSGNSFLSNGNDQRQIPEAIKKWSGCVEIWLNMLYKEEATLRTRNARNCSRTSPFLPRMRAILVDWIMEVCEVYQLRRNTYYLALDYIDRFLTHRPSIPKTQLQLLGVTCLLIAAKLEEIYPPKLSEFAYVCDGACTEKEILTCERLVLHALGWDVNPMTPTTWLNLYMQIECMPSSIPQQLQSQKVCATTTPCSPTNVEIYFPAYSAYKFVRASQVMDLFSLDPGYSRFSYSVIAAAAMHLVSGETAAQLASGLTRDHIDLCLAHMSFFYTALCNADNPRLLSVQGNGAAGPGTGIPPSVSFMGAGDCYSPAANLANAVDDNQVASYRAIRASVPNLIRDENHTMQTHCIDLDYYERAVVLRLEWLGFTVEKLYSRESKQVSEQATSSSSPCKSCSNSPDSDSAGCNSNCSCDTIDNSESTEEDEPTPTVSTVVMYQLERTSHVNADADNGSNNLLQSDVVPNSTDGDNENNNIFALQQSEKQIVNFDAILCSVHRDCTDKMLMSLWRQPNSPSAK